MKLSDFTVALEKVALPLAKKNNLSVFIARADAVYPLASGNKLYKLLPTIDYAKRNNYQQILSFGGAFSNHIHALALYTQAVGLKSIAIIRGEKEYAKNPTLSVARAAGMTLIFVDRATYRRRYDKDYLQQLQQQYPKALLLAEGGSNALALQGCAELMRQINQQYLQMNQVLPDEIAVACGTGTTFSGLVIGAEREQYLHGYLVVKDYSVPLKVDELLSHHNQRYTLHSADCGGYAKLDAQLLAFILMFLEQTHLLLDPIYTSKMCYRIMQQIEAGQFKRGSKLVIVHSGGLQAWHGMKQKVISLSDHHTWQKIEASL
jgi:1-aminocyclopropane-1-carboxylate deaminase/D-cysteine desulfhydrase-like pyridoxal-dependent ACC family enzyme